MHQDPSTPFGPSCRQLFVAIACLVVLVAPRPAQSDQHDLRIALLPIIDSFPYHVALAEKLFEQSGIRVQGLSVSSAVNRDQLMQSGEIDGMLNELMTTANFNRQTPQLKIVAVVREADQDHPLFRILGSPGSMLRQATDLAGTPIGISRNTIIEYVTDRLLQHAGVAADTVRKQSIPSIPERYQLLMQGRVKAATLPDPLAQSAMASGAVLLIDDRAIAGVSLSVLSFSDQAIGRKTSVVKRFLDAWNRAVERINANPEAYRPLLLQKIRIPPNIQDSYRVPPFAYRRVPNRKQWQDVMGWMVDRKLLDHPIAFSTSVNPDLLNAPAVPSAPNAPTIQ